MEYLYARSREYDKNGIAAREIRKRTSMCVKFKSYRLNIKLVFFYSFRNKRKEKKRDLTRGHTVRGAQSACLGFHYNHIKTTVTYTGRRHRATLIVFTTLLCRLVLINRNNIFCLRNIIPFTGTYIH